MHDEQRTLCPGMACLPHHKSVSKQGCSDCLLLSSSSFKGCGCVLLYHTRAPAGRQSSCASAAAPPPARRPAPAASPPAAASPVRRARAPRLQTQGPGLVRRAAPAWAAGGRAAVRPGRAGLCQGTRDPAMLPRLQAWVRLAQRRPRACHGPCARPSRARRRAFLRARFCRSHARVCRLAPPPGPDAPLLVEGARETTAKQEEGSLPSSCCRPDNVRLIRSEKPAV